MKITRLEKILLALMLAGSLTRGANAATYNVYSNDYATVTVTVNTKTDTYTYTDANGKTYTCKYTTITEAPTVTANVTDLSNQSDLSDLNLSYETTQEGEKQYKYYAWVEEIDETTQEPTGNYVFTDITTDVSNGTLGADSANLTVSYVQDSTYEGGIYNDGGTNNTYEGKNITADFVGDSSHGSESDATHGGAIDNYANSGNASLGTITGNFIGNYESVTTGGKDYGGAIANYVSGSNKATIESINGNFIGNYVTTATETTGEQTYGGAIYNNGSTAKIGSIEGDFIGNYVERIKEGEIGEEGDPVEGDDGTVTVTQGEQSNSYSYGGAIYNGSGEIGSVTGNFIGNAAKSSGIDGIVTETTTDDTGTTKTTTTYYGGASSGGAIYNSSGTIGTIKGDFVGNYAETSGTSANGGAIRNSGTINTITGDFIGNYAKSTGTGSAHGGAVYNTGIIGTENDDGTVTGGITGDFIGNSIYAVADNTWGAAVYNSGAAGKIGSITGNFIGNGSESGSGTGRAGAIYNASGGTIFEINGDFIGNYSKSETNYVEGGAIFNNSYSIIGNITGNFIGNYAEASNNHARGGAIQNYLGTIGDLTGDFIGNYVKAGGADTTVSSSYYAYGGAIYNMSGTTSGAHYDGKIGDITGNFIGNYAETSGYRAYGGAIYNSASGSTIGNITGNFIGNYAKSTATSGTVYAYGGAIYNSSATIGNITGDFIGNYADSAGSHAYGGAIFNNSGVIGDIKGDFIGNYATSTGSSSTSLAWGGAIYNEGGSINSIKGNFIDNKATSAANDSFGGAIYNEGKIGTTTTGADGTVSAATDGISGSTFQGNEATRGGAIYNGTYKNSSYTWQEGVYNGVISSITDTWFVKNTATNYGGAIYNYDDGAIYSIADCYFMENVAENGNGGAIENAEAHSYIGAITNSYFYKNDVSQSDHGGGAIYNEGIIQTLKGNEFVENTSKNFGGAIYNNGGSFAGSGGAIEENYFYGNESNRGGAIYNTVTRSVVDTSENASNLDKNLTSLGISETFDLAGISSAEGSGSIFSITGNTFMNNKANNFGGAIYNYHGGDIGAISDNLFYGNEAKGGNGGAVENAEYDTSIGTMKNNVFAYNKATGNGGAIYNQGTIGIIKTTDETSGEVTSSVGDAITNSTFVGNEAKSGGAIYNNYGTSTVYFYDKDSTTSSINGAVKVDDASTNSDGNYLYSVEEAGAGAIGNITNCYFEGNKATEGSGGAIYNASGTITDDETGVTTKYTTTMGTITNTSFVNNSATDKGGAIYSASDLTIAADGSQDKNGDSTVIFKGNTAGSDDNAIYMATHYDEDGKSVASNLSFSLTNGGTIYMYDNIKGESGSDGSGYGVTITGTGTENKFYLLNDVNAVSEVSRTSVKPYETDTSDATTNNADLSVGGVSLYTTLYTLSDEAHVYKTNSFTLTGNIDMYADVDFANEVMDHFETTGEGGSSVSDDATDAKLNVAGLNGLTDTDEDRVAIYFAEEGLMKNVTSSAGTVYAPIYTYSANYLYLDNDANGDQKIYANGNEYDVSDSELFSASDYANAGYFVFNKTGINPAAMATSVASMATYGFMSMMFEYNFEHSDYYMKLPEDVRLSMNENAKKAPKENDATRPEYYNQNELTYRGAWARSFFSNESVDYGSGWNSRDKYYGAMVGFDSNMHVSKNGWANVTTGYVGTMGIRQQFSGGHIKQHGGFVGITESFYKKNFYTAWTIAAGSMKAHEHTMYGHDKDRIDDYGIAARFGWNIDMDYNGKFAILPTFTASYSYIHPEDFTNSADVKITGSGMRAVQLNPNVKLIWKMNDGWQPYLTVGEIWTVGESSHIRADSVKLPELDLKAYTEYGIGVQKRWSDEKDAYIQLLGHSDGRDGILLNAGVRWNF